MKVLANKEISSLLCILRTILLVIILSFYACNKSDKIEQYSLDEYTLKLIDNITSSDSIKFEIHSYTSDSTSINIIMDAVTNLGNDKINVSFSSDQSRITRPAFCEITYQDKYHEMDLLQKIENHNMFKLWKSPEQLEYEIAKTIRLFLQKESPQLAFIEGHGESDGNSVHEAEELLSEFFTINRGKIIDAGSSIFDMDVLIIAAPYIAFTEVEKYILDQYIFAGGRVLWLVDGIVNPQEELSIEGYSVRMKNELNLDDLLFAYGVRINSDIVIDKHSSPQLIDGNMTFFPWNTVASYHDGKMINGYTDSVSLSFASSISLVNEHLGLKKEILLASSENSDLQQTPIGIDLSDIPNQSDINKHSHIPMAVSIEGIFTSAYENRILSKHLAEYNFGYTKNAASRMVVVANSELIRNKLVSNGEDYIYLPMGWSETKDEPYQNREFILNCVNWLMGDDELIKLRNKEKYKN